jgi:uncharacterized membrane protein HdeD (DUF308 family)
MTTNTTADAERATRTIAPRESLTEYPKPYQWRWWTVVLRGAAAILFGILAVFAPTAAFASLVILFGIYALVDGALVLGMGIRERAYHRGAMIGRGIVSLAAGALALGWPGISSVALLFVIATWAIVAGIFEIVMSIRLRVPHEWLLRLEGALSIVFGVLLFMAPLAGAVILGLWVGAYALVFGGMLVETGFRLRSYALAQ